MPAIATVNLRDASPVLGVTTFTNNVAQAPGRGVIVSVTVAGTITFTFTDGSTFQPTIPIGCFDFKWSVTTTLLGSATATIASYL